MTLWLEISSCIQDIKTIFPAVFVLTQPGKPKQDVFLTLAKCATA